MRASPELRLLHVFSSFAVGGPQVRFCDLANSLGSAYHHIIIAMDQNVECATRLAAGVSWEIQPVVVAKSHGISLGNLARFRRLLTKLKPDLLLTYNWGALEWAIVNRWRPEAAHIHFEDGFGPEENPNFQLRRRVYLRRLVLGENTRLVVPSVTLSTLATTCWGLNPDHVLLIGNGVDCHRFTRAYSRPLFDNLGINSESLVVGTVAALRPEKNLGRLITAFARLTTDPQPHLILVGEGDERSRLEQLAVASGVAARTHFLGAVRQPEELYGGFDIFAMSSDTEQMPISLLEAMATGLPVIATDVGDISSIIAKENRALIEGCHDDITLAQRLAVLISNPALRAHLGRCNRVRACDEFGLSKMVERYKAVFEETEPTMSRSQ